MLDLYEQPRKSIIIIRDWRVFLVIGIALLLVVSGAAWYFFTPRIIEISPSPNEIDVLSKSTIQVTFSQPMDISNTSNLLTFDPAIQGSFTWVNNTLVFTPVTTWVPGEKVRVKIGSGLRSRLGLPLIDTVSWGFTTKHFWLLYLIDQGSKTELYRLDPEGTETEKIINPSESILDYQSNLDGKTILYAVKVGNNTEIRLHDLIEGSEKLLHTCVNATCYQTMLSKDFRYLAFVSGAVPQTGIKTESTVWILSLNEFAEVGDPIPVAGNDHITRDPSWSTSGWIAYYDDDAKGYGFYQANSGQRVFLANDTGEPGVWSPVADIFFFSQIIYAQSIDPSSPSYYSQINSFDLDTGITKAVSTNDQSEDVSPMISPDGKQMAFGRRFLNAQDWSPGRQLWVISTDGSNPRPITNEPEINHLGFSWSPDGSQIAYTVFNTASLTGNRELWIANQKTGITRKLLMDAYNLQWLD